MKSRRVTIFCVAMIALAGTPRAWQEVGKLLAVVQHKAQVKFWSMVLQPGDKGAAGAEAFAAARSLKAASAEVASNCPLPGAESWGSQLSSTTRANRTTASVSLPPKARAPEQPARTHASYAGLIARAPKAQLENSSVEHLYHSRNLLESQSSVVAESRAASPALPGAATLPHPPASNSDAFRFVLIPAPTPAVVSALVQKENITQLKLFKKSLDDSKSIRQKVRLPVSRGLAAFPSS